MLGSWGVTAPRPIAFVESARSAPRMAAPNGLTRGEAERLLAEHGPNEIVRARGRSKLAILGAQFKSPLIALLAVAAVISGAMGELADTIAIATILVINAAVGFFQEHRAETALL